MYDYNGPVLVERSSDARLEGKVTWSVDVLLKNKLALNMESRRESIGKENIVCVCLCPTFGMDSVWKLKALR